MLWLPANQQSTGKTRDGDPHETIIALRTSGRKKGVGRVVVSLTADGMST
jgi:hypothetical protein